MSKRKIAIAIGIVLTVIVVLSLLIFVFGLGDLGKSGTEQREFNIHEEIEILNSERDPWEKYSIQEYDWKVWKQWEASGGVLIKMDSWKDFKESLKQNSWVYLLMLDEENKVIWYKSTATTVVYYCY